MHFSLVVRFKPLALEGRQTVCVLPGHSALPPAPSEEAVGTFAQKLALIQRHSHKGVKLYNKILYDMNCINTTKVP